MMIEAIRFHLAKLGIEGVEDWSREQVLAHVDQMLKEQAEECESPAMFDEQVDEMLHDIKINFMTVRQVLSEDLHS